MASLLARRRVLILAVTSLAASACRGSTAAPGVSSATPTTLLAANPAAGVWPDRYRGAAAVVREAYDFAVTPEGARALSYIPCYCGCAASGHRSNADCYVDEFRAGGWVALDGHGFG
jgi:hypothetical protein